VVLGALAFAIPAVLDSYNLFLVTLVAIYAIATLGLDIVFGRAGQLSLAQATFVGLGAYVTALTADQLPVVVQLPLVILVSLVAGVVVAVPTLRLSGLRLALVTLLFGELFEWAINHMGDVTGGSQGLAVPPLSVGGFSSLDPVDAYWLAITIAVIATLLTIQLGRSQLGRRMLAVRDSEMASVSMGISVVRTKVIAFILSAVLASISGWLYAYTVGFIAPSTFVLFPSVYFLVAVILGGSGKVLGSWLGAIYIVLLPQAFTVMGQPNLFPIAGGAVMVAVAMLLPGGFVDGGNRLVAWWRAGPHGRRGAAVEGLAPATEPSETTDG
jgi:branched-chain amino acid transport system permease protein